MVLFSFQAKQSSEVANFSSVRYKSENGKKKGFLLLLLLLRYSGSSSIGRVSAFQAEGCGFEARLPLQFRILMLNKRFVGLLNQ